MARQAQELFSELRQKFPGCLKVTVHGPTAFSGAAVAFEPPLMKCKHDAGLGDQAAYSNGKVKTLLRSIASMQAAKVSLSWVHGRKRWSIVNRNDYGPLTCCET